MGTINCPVLPPSSPTEFINFPSKLNLDSQCDFVLIGYIKIFLRSLPKIIPVGFILYLLMPELTEVVSVILISCKGLQQTEIWNLRSPTHSVPMQSSIHTQNTNIIILCRVVMASHQVNSTSQNSLMCTKTRIWLPLAKKKKKKRIKFYRHSL